MSIDVLEVESNLKDAEIARLTRLLAAAEEQQEYDATFILELRMRVTEASDEVYEAIQSREDMRQEREAIRRSWAESEKRLRECMIERDKMRNASITLAILHGIGGGVVR